MFDDWASTYDQTVSGEDLEYKEVFQGYDEILQSVVSYTKGDNVIEFGVGTGNLTKRLVNHGFNVYGVEPSLEMLKIAQVKVPDARIQEGDFLQFTSPVEQVDSIVSSYAFHHLTDEEKEHAIRNYSKLLASGGRIVFADTSFETKDAKRQSIETAIASYRHHLADDLSSEYYSDIPTLRNICENNEFDVIFRRKNQYVWLMIATKR